MAGRARHSVSERDGDSDVGRDWIAYADGNVVPGTDRDCDTNADTNAYAYRDASSNSVSHWSVGRADSV